MSTIDKLVSFGNFLFKTNKVRYKKTGDIREVTHADLENWKETAAFPVENSFPSRYGIGEWVGVEFNQSHTGNHAFIAKIHAVHFTISKVKYDLEIPICEEYSTRIYNVDSCFVHPATSML